MSDQGPTRIASPTTVGLMRVPGIPLATGIHARAAWDALDPFAVSIVFAIRGLPNSDVQWVFARELLYTLGGDGDIRLERLVESHDTAITVDSPSGRATIFVPSKWLDDFLAYTEVVMPLGHEPSVVDDEDAWQAALAVLSTPRD